METADLRRLEEIGHVTWPALEEERRDGWLLRAAGGVTRRANSVSPVGLSSIAVDDQIAHCESWYADRGLPAIFRLTAVADPDLDDRLASRRYQRHAGAVIMTRPSAGLVSQVGGGPRVELAEAPDPAWLDLMARQPGRGGAMRGVLMQMFEALESPACFATAHHGGVAAIGPGVAADYHLALYMMQTVPQRRRRGLGTAIAGTPAAWGTGHGARQLFLQVHPENAPALSFYPGLGFESRYEYWYRQRAAGRTSVAARMHPVSIVSANLVKRTQGVSMRRLRTATA